MILTFLSSLDVLAGLVLIFKIEWLPLRVVLTLFIFLKALFSLLSSLSHNNYLDWMGAIDMATAIAFMISFVSYENSFVHTAGMLALLKGLYSLILSRGM